MAFDRTRILKEGKSRVFVITEQYEFLGDIHLINLDRRETDVLNDNKPFIHLTDVDVKIKGTENKRRHVPFVAVNKRNIICVIPLEQEAAVKGVERA
jgi:hypothetical protein